MHCIWQCSVVFYTQYGVIIVSDLGAFRNCYWPLCNTNELRGKFLNRSHQPHACLIWQTVLIESLEFFRAHSLQWRHNEHNGVSNHKPHDCLINCLLRRRSKKTSRFRVTVLCEGNLQRVSNVENVSIWWRHHILYSVMLTAKTILLSALLGMPIWLVPVTNWVLIDGIYW